MRIASKLKGFVPRKGANHATQCEVAYAVDRGFM